MKRVILSYLLLLEAAEFCYSQNVTILPVRNVFVIPSLTNGLTPGVPLSCALEPDTLVNYTTRWILPGGQIITSNQGRYVFFEGMVAIDVRQLPGTVLVVPQLSYLDAGTYTCEGRSTDPGASTVWASASLELQLNLELLSNSMTVTIVDTMDDNNIVALQCEMRAFIRPDSSLIWEGPGGQRITGGTDKHQITFSDRSPDAAANGGAALVPSRVSTLTISNPELSDAGIYTCTVMGTSQAIAFNLLVNSTVINDSSTELADVTEATNTDGLNIASIIGFTIAAVLVCLLAIAVAALCARRYIGRGRKQNSSNIDSNPVYYDYPMSLPDGDGGRIINGVKANEAYGEATGGIVTMEMNAAYSVVRDGIDVMEMNAAYGVARDGIVNMETNAAYGVARDGLNAMEMNAA